MKIFVTWSGEKSKAVALSLRQWIPDVIHTAGVWMSEIDIPAGDRWSATVARELEQANFGVICLTKGNLREPWVFFEAGALAKQLSNSFVCPYLIDLHPFELPPGPLTQFQAKEATEEGTWDLITAINDALDPHGLPADRLQRSFARCWPDLSRRLHTLPPEASPETPDRSTADMMREVLDLTRDLARRVRRQEDLLERATPGAVEHPQSLPPNEAVNPPAIQPKDFSQMRQEPKDVEEFLEVTRGS